MELYLGFIILMSLITLCVYISDKQKAKKNKWRIPEKVLLLLSFLGGSIGGLIALYGFRHKNKHWYFVVVNILSLLIHIALGYFVYTKIGLLYL